MVGFFENKLKSDLNSIKIKEKIRTFVSLLNISNRYPSHDVTITCGKRKFAH